MIISEQALTLSCCEIKDPQELNMMLKRVIEQIIVFNIGKRWRVKKFCTETNTLRASFGMVKKLASSLITKKLLELFKSQTEEV
jgi:hypothetical protein